MQITLENGKYEYTFDESTGSQCAYRHGELWRDLTGDNLVLAMAHKIKELEAKVKEIQSDKD